MMSVRHLGSVSMKRYKSGKYKLLHIARGSSTWGRKRRLVRFFFLAVAAVVFLLLYRTPKPEEFQFTIGTVIRGDEWTGDMTYKNAATINALKGFIRSTGSPSRVVILVDFQSYCETVPDFLRGCRCYGLYACTDPVYEVPTMECIFDILFDVSTTDTVAFINGDILVFDSFAKAIASTASAADEFLMTGRRHRGEGFRADFNDPISWRYAEIHSKTLSLDHGYAIDYFVTKKSVYNSVLRGALPPFVIGAWRWDNILMYYFYKFTDVTVFDATFVAPVMHQFQNSSLMIDHHQRRGARFNDELAKQISGNELLFGTIDFADVILEDLSEGQDFIKDPWHVLAREALKSGLLTPPEISRLKEFNDHKLATYNQRLLSTEDHLLILRDFRNTDH